jgi:hypothetical protein
MRQVQRVGLWLAIGLLCASLLSLVGCGGADDGGDAAARVSQVAVQILPADQASRNTCGLWQYPVSRALSRLTPVIQPL